MTSRRAYLAAVGGATASLTGCLGLGGDGSSYSCSGSDPDTVEELPQPTMGNPDADVVVKAWEDFSCPHCRTFSLQVLPKLKSEYADPGTILFEHHDWPIPVREWAWEAASAARSVQDAADDAAFFDFAHQLFENQDSYSTDLLGSAAEAVDLEPCTVIQDGTSGTYRPVVEADKQRGTEAGVQGTPWVLVNGEYVSPTYEKISAKIESAL
ncbi:thioredoxin domain-containing protein [Halobaculum sp. D14]|uniref:thioredoxin domain-containing protein n=1 Tax=unclassified Halobaculum TaxID=2640896 RepID=UPI003EBDE58C